MTSILRTRFSLGHQTVAFPPVKEMPARFRGRPVLHPEKCVAGCSKCADACPCKAISLDPMTLDLGKCTLCEVCTSSCEHGAIEHTRDIRMTVNNRRDLFITGKEMALAKAMDERTHKLFGRSLKLRVVTAGSCSGCEMELNAAGNIQFDLSRFGIQVVASPRHADGIIVTGPVSVNMRLALEKTYAAVASPKIVVAVGTCAISRSPFIDSDKVCKGASDVVPVDLFIAGCPPHPLTIIDGLLRVLGRL